MPYSHVSTGPYVLAAQASVLLNVFGSIAHHAKMGRILVSSEPGPNTASNVLASSYTLPMWRRAIQPGSLLFMPSLFHVQSFRVELHSSPAACKLYSQPLNPLREGRGEGGGGRASGLMMKTQC